MRRISHVGIITTAVGALVAAFLVIAGPASAQSSAGSVSAGGVTLAPGHVSQQVREWQRQLLRAGESPGPIDGRLGPLTAAAVRRFQDREGLATTGVVRGRTAVALKRAQ